MESRRSTTDGIIEKDMESLSGTALWLSDFHKLIRLDRSGNGLLCARRPLDLDPVDGVGVAEPEIERGVALREVTRFAVVQGCQCAIADVLGKLTQDRFPAVAGSLGRECPMIPVKARVENTTNRKTQTLDVEMINARNWSPILLYFTSAYLLLLEGVKSGKASPLTKQDWAELRTDVAERLQKRWGGRGKKSR